MNLYEAVNYFLTEAEKISPKAMDFNKLYKDHNDKYFGGILPIIPIELANFKNVGGQAVGMTDPPNDKIVPVKIRISSNFTRSADDWDKILLHEMIHVYFYVTWTLRKYKSLPNKHGIQFQAKAEEVSKEAGLDIPLTDDLEFDLDKDMKPVNFLLWFGEATGRKKWSITCVSKTVAAKYMDNIERWCNRTNSNCYSGETTIPTFFRYPKKSTLNSMDLYDVPNEAIPELLKNSTQIAGNQEVVMPT